jgi:hypothetical protein
MGRASICGAIGFEVEQARCCGSYQLYWIEEDVFFGFVAFPREMRCLDHHVISIGSYTLICILCGETLHMLSSPCPTSANFLDVFLNSDARQLRKNIRTSF